MGKGVGALKKCVKSLPEPECLSQFRQANPAGTWDEFRDHQQGGAYQTVRDATRTDQGGLCAYCEIDLNPSNEQIAHFHPKSDKGGPRNWALEWTNLWLTCKGGSPKEISDRRCFLPPVRDNLSCDAVQGSAVLDGVVLTPHEVPAFPRLFRYQQLPDRIEIHADEVACRSAGINTEKVEQTIEKFNLNCARLSMARLALLRQLEQAVKQLQMASVDPRVGLAALARRHLGRHADGHWPPFFTLVRWRFRESAEAYLHSIHYDG